MCDKIEAIQKYIFLVLLFYINIKVDFQFNIIHFGFGTDRVTINILLWEEKNTRIRASAAGIINLQI